jgi:hypothetical protein
VALRRSQVKNGEKNEAKNPAKNRAKNGAHVRRNGLGWIAVVSGVAFGVVSGVVSGCRRSLLSSGS